MAKGGFAKKEASHWGKAVFVGRAWGGIVKRTCETILPGKRMAVVEGPRRGRKDWGTAGSGRKSFLTVFSGPNHYFTGT